MLIYTARESYISYVAYGILAFSKKKNLFQQTLLILF